MQQEFLGKVILPFGVFDLTKDSELESLFCHLEVCGLSLNRIIAKDLAKHIVYMLKEFDKQDNCSHTSTKERENDAIMDSSNNCNMYLDS